MTSSPIPPGAIVVGLDGSSESVNALDWATAYAADRDLPLHLVHADNPDCLPEDADEEARSMDEICRRGLSRVQRREPGLSLTWSQPQTRPASALVAAADTATTVVVGSRGSGALQDALLGSVPISVSALARCPVVVVGPSISAGHSAGPVVVGVDHGHRTQPVLQYAFEEARRRSVPLVAVHAWLMDPFAYATVLPTSAEDGTDTVTRAHHDLEQILTGWAERFPTVELRRRVVRSDPTEALVKYSADAGLLVVGTHGRRAVGGLLLGSVSQGAMRNASCPVVVVPTPTAVDQSVADRVAAAGV
ncbi:universal stress protein [Luteipulveratus mongoliensis]|uniref:UspA domain-containing protein n=1 Tax=Luteipulveratus mongoliensis TaxID=571913 RepID=A0A0K1JFW3_9MICO|nr:universal stress protein [Luteipulveratus mongoliensis]AKU15473.1 hypothetical protein VV02_05665 [Luteipulveratus mongoliensis]